MSADSNTPVTFSPEEVQKIRETLRMVGERPVCPLCDRDLVAESSAASVTSVSWHVRCQPCHRAAIINVARVGRVDPDK